MLKDLLKNTLDEAIQILKHAFLRKGCNPGMVLAGLLFLISCSQSSQETYTSFPQEVSLTGRAIHTGEIIKSPWQILFLEDAFLVMDSKADYSLHAFAVADCEHLGSFLRRGSGPEEALYVQSIGAISGNRFFYKTLTHIKRADFDPVILSVETTDSEQIDVDNLLMAFVLDGNYFGWNRKEREREFIRYHAEDGSFSNFGPAFPVLDRKLTLFENLAFFSDKAVTVKPDGDLFAAVYMSYPFLRIMNSKNGQLTRELRLDNGQLAPESMNRQSRAMQSQNFTENYYRICSTNDYIYALYSGKTRSENNVDQTSAVFVPYDFSNEIHVWDWEGNPIKRIQLDRQIFDFGVNTDDKLLIGFSLQTPEQLLVYEL